MREDDITGISQEFDLVLSRVMPPRRKGAQEREHGDGESIIKCGRRRKWKNGWRKKTFRQKEKRIRIEKQIQAGRRSFKVQQTGILRLFCAGLLL